VTTYNGTLGWNGAAQYFAVDFDAPKTEVQLQNLSGAPLVFNWFVQAMTCLPFATIYFSTQDAARGGLTMPTGGGVVVTGTYSQSFAIEVLDGGD
jgi:hypothetical protein